MHSIKSLDNIVWIDSFLFYRKEKAHEVSRMRDYYNNATVTLIAIHAEVGEENIRKLIKSFEPGEIGKTARIFSPAPNGGRLPRSSRFSRPLKQKCSMKCISTASTASCIDMAGAS